MTACLHRLLLPYDSLGPGGHPESEFAGFTGFVLILASPRGTDHGAKGVIDTVEMFFFKNNREAEKAQARLAQFYVYFRYAPFAYLRYLRSIPPNTAALHTIERITGNVDIFWNYPRRHPVASDRTLGRCLGG